MRMSGERKPTIQRGHKIMKNGPFDLIAGIIRTLERVSGEKEESD